MTGPSTQTLWITVAIFRWTENESQKEETKEGVGEGRRQGRVAEGGWGRVVKHRAEANDNPGFNLRRCL